MREIALVVLGAGLVAALPGFGVALQRGLVGAPARVTGGAVALCVMLAWGVEHAVLAPLALASLRTFAAVMIVASCVLVANHAANRGREDVDALPSRLVPLSVAACCALALGAIDVAGQPFAGMLVHAVGAGVGVGIAMVLFAALRQRTDVADVPAPFRGAPIALLNAAFVALALMGLAGLGAG